MKRLCLSIALMSLLGALVFAQREAPIVTVKVIPSADIFKPGQTYDLAIELTIRSPYHINSDQPTEDYLIPVTVDFTPKKGITFGKVIFPPADMRKLELSENPLSIYEGKVQIKTSVALAADFKEKELLIDGRIGYQACDNRSCLAPTNVAFSRKIAVEVSGIKAADTSKVGAAKELGTRTKDSSASAAPDDAVSHSSAGERRKSSPGRRIQTAGN